MQFYIKIKLDLQQLHLNLSYTNYNYITMSKDNVINNHSPEVDQKYQLLPESQINQLKKIFTVDVNANSNLKAERPIYDSLVKLKNNILDLNSYQMNKVFKMYSNAQLNKQISKYPKILTFEVVHNLSLIILLTAAISLPKRYMLKILFGFSIVAVNFKIVERYFCMKCLEQMALSDNMDFNEQQARNILEYKYRIQGTGSNRHAELDDQVKEMLHKIDQRTQKYFKMKKIEALL